MIASLSHLKKDDESAGGDSLYASACHVLESLDSFRSCCILAELSNDALEAHKANADEQVCRLMNTLFDVMMCVYQACARVPIHWRGLPYELRQASPLALRPLPL